MRSFTEVIGATQAGDAAIARRILGAASYCDSANRTMAATARERGIRRYIFLLTRAHGLGFDPHDIERPIRWEGDHAGFGWPFSAAEGLELWQRDFAPYPELRDSTRWFVRFMEKLADGQEFGLHELQHAATSFTVEKIS